MSSARQNESECPITYPLRCNMLTWRAPKIDQSAVFEKSDPLTEKIKFLYTAIHADMHSHIPAKFSGNL